DELVRDADRREYGKALEAWCLGVGAQFAHLAVEVSGRLQQAFAFFRRSSDFSRWIIASTRLRACSLRASRPARSPESCSWLWRRLRFSSLSRRTVSS